MSIKNINRTKLAVVDWNDLAFFLRGQTKFKEKNILKLFELSL